MEDSPLCHPDRSEAEWRDLRFSGPLVEMFFDNQSVVERSAAFAKPSAPVRQLLVRNQDPDSMKLHAHPL